MIWPAIPMRALFAITCFWIILTSNPHCTHLSVAAPVGDMSKTMSENSVGRGGELDGPTSVVMPAMPLLQHPSLLRMTMICSTIHSLLWRNRDHKVCCLLSMRMDCCIIIKLAEKAFITPNMFAAFPPSLRFLPAALQPPKEKHNSGVDIVSLFPQLNIVVALGRGRRWWLVVYTGWDSIRKS